MALELNGTTGVSLVQDGVVTAADLASGAITAAALPAGSVLKVAQTQITSPALFNNTGSTWYDMTGVTVNITPSSTSNKILVIAHISGGSRPGYEKTPWRFVRNGTAIGVGDASSTRPLATIDPFSYEGYWTGVSSMMWLDSPSSTSEQTYKLQYYGLTGSAFYMNRCQNDRDGVDARSVSTITVMEIAA